MRIGRVVGGYGINWYELWQSIGNGNWIEIILNPNEMNYSRWINQIWETESNQLISSSPSFRKILFYWIIYFASLPYSVQLVHWVIASRMILLRLLLLCVVTGKLLGRLWDRAVHSGDCRLFQSSSICAGDGEREIKEVFVRFDECVWTKGLWWDHRRGCFWILCMQGQLEDCPVSLWPHSVHLSGSM